MVGVERISLSDPNWINSGLRFLKRDGVVVVEGCLSNTEAETISSSLENALESARSSIGRTKLERSGELGIVRSPYQYSDVFFSVLINSTILNVVESVLGTTAILHLQNGIVLEPHHSGNSSSFQETLHRDFPRYLDGYVASLNSFICLSNFTNQNGATKFVVGSHQNPQDFAPDKDLTFQVEATKGDVIFFDSTIWHAGGVNETSSNRNALNMQWTKSFIKQQIDHVRLVGQQKMSHLPERIQQVLGQYTRIPASMSEYYVPPEERLYRSGQG